jgi:general secretion pathway protein G
MSFDFGDPDLRIASVALVAAVAALIYCIVRARNWRDEFGLIDAGILFIAIATGSAAAVPLINVAQKQANQTVLMTDLHTLRTQIALYQAQHSGNVPLLYQGAFPQLTQPTNATGVPGTHGTAFPYGPYWSQRIPANSFTGIATVTPVKEFPPKAPTGTGGWVYHQESGRIAPDLEGYLER